MKCQNINKQTPHLSLLKFERYKNCNGFTLVELLVALGLFSIVMTIVFTFFGYFSQVTTTSEVRSRISGDINAAFGLMEQELRMAGYDPGGDAGAAVVTASDTTFRFQQDTLNDGTLTDVDDDEIAYVYSGNTIWRQDRTDLAGALQGDELITNVTACRFIYYDVDGVQLSATPLVASDRSLIRTIRVDITVSAPAGREGMITQTASTRVRARNLGI